jgi:hypothetical protein
LLQVPNAATPGTPKARPAAPGAQPTEAKRPATPGDLSNRSGVRPATPDIGGSSSGLRQGRPAAPVATAPAQPRKIEKVSPIGGPTRGGAHLKQVKKNNALLLAGIGLAGVIVIVVVIIVIKVLLGSPEPLPVVDDGSGGGKVVAPGVPHGAVKGGGGSTGQGPDHGPAPAPAASEEVKGFIGVPLTGKKILFSIDGASSMTDSFNFVCRGVYRAMDKLEPGQQVRVAVWRGNSVKLVPASGFVGKSGAKQLHDALEMIAATGSSDAVDCMKASLEEGADQVIFVTAKYGLDSSIADTILASYKGDVRFDGVKIESDDTQSPLEMLAKKTGGSYRVVSTGKLDELTR